MSGFCATGKQIKKWKKRLTDECPMCTQVEDHHHIIQCQSLVVTNLWSEKLDQYKDQLRQMRTPEETIQAMSKLLNDYRTMNTSPSDMTDPTLEIAVIKQRQLGPNCFIEGLLVDEWKDHVSTFLTPRQNMQ